MAAASAAGAVAASAAAASKEGGGVATCGGGGGDEPPFGGDGPVVGDVIVGGWHASLGRTGRQARRAGAERSVGMRTVERQWRRDSDGDTNEREPGSTQCGRRRRRRGGDVPKTIKNKIGVVLARTSRHSHLTQNTSSDRLNSRSPHSKCGVITTTPQDHSDAAARKFLIYYILHSYKTNLELAHNR